jgi:RNA polymerase sigma factor (TIGR02999 family)
MTEEEGRVTGLLLAWGRGDETALEALTPLVYEELRRLARRCLRGERTAQTLQPTALVNEAFIRLVDLKRVQWHNRTQFFAISARLMRRILVDLARSRLASKRGRGGCRVTLDENLLISTEPGEDVVAIDEALDALSKVDLRKARVVELRFFGGLSVEESAEVLQVSRDTVIRDWKVARAWLLRELNKR